MTSQQLEAQMDRVLANLVRELAEVAPAGEITSVSREHYERLRGPASITEFIPLLVYRFTKEELVTSRREELHHAA